MVAAAEVASRWLGALVGEDPVPSGARVEEESKPQVDAVDLRFQAMEQRLHASFRYCVGCGIEGKSARF